MEKENAAQGLDRLGFEQLEHENASAKTQSEEREREASRYKALCKVHATAISDVEQRLERAAQELIEKETQLKKLDTSINAKEKRRDQILKITKKKKGYLAKDQAAVSRHVVESNHKKSLDEKKAIMEQIKHLEQRFATASTLLNSCIP